MELPLRLISRSLPPQVHLWTDCVRAINLGNTARSADTVFHHYADNASGRYAAERQCASARY